MIYVLLALFLSPAGAPGIQDTAVLHEDAARGYALDIPEGWQKVEEKNVADAAHVLNLLPPGANGTVAFSVRMQQLPDGTELPDFHQNLRRLVSEREDLSELVEELESCAGEERPRVRLDCIAQDGSTYVLEQTAVDANERRYVLQRFAPEDAFAAHAEAFAELIDSFQVIAVVEDPDLERDRALDAIAARAGEQVDWAASWDAAAEEALRRQVPILVVVWRYQSFGDLPTPKTTLFLDPEITDAVNAHTVPLWADTSVRTKLEDPDVYGMGGSAFGQGLLLCMPDGEVLLETHAASSAVVAQDFLARGLALADERFGPAEQVESGVAPIDLAKDRLFRMDAKGALALLEGIEDFDAALLRARASRMLRDRGAALAAILSAKTMPGARTEDQESALLNEQATIYLGRGDTEMARSLLDEFVERFPEADDAAHARLLLAQMNVADTGIEGLREAMIEVAFDFPDHPAGWAAAALYDSALLDADNVTPDGWPDPSKLLAATHFVPPVHSRGVKVDVPSSDLDKAIEGAAAFLAAQQSDDGTWITPSSISTDPAPGEDPFLDAVTALATLALLEHGEATKSGSKSARFPYYAEIEQGITATARLVRARAEAELSPKFMDYTPWSASMQIELLSTAVERGLGGKDAREALDLAAAHLGLSAAEQGGWSYYLTNDLDGPGQPPHAISFTTAAAVHALARARDVGASLPEGLLEQGTDVLSRMRDEDDVFTYFLWHGQSGIQRSSGQAGSVGRGPVCERALALSQKVEDPRPQLDRALTMFVRHAASYDAERGKAMMHAGPQAQGCHYLLFDYFHGAKAWRDSSRTAKARVRLLELVLGCQLEDGSFQDTPILGRNYGTAMALMALHALAEWRTLAKRQATTQ